MINQWRKRKRMFKDVWDAITENSPKNLKEFKEELGVEYDVGVSLQSFGEIVQGGEEIERDFSKKVVLVSSKFLLLYKFTFRNVYAVKSWQYLWLLIYFSRQSSFHFTILAAS